MRLFIPPLIFVTHLLLQQPKLDTLNRWCVSKPLLPPLLLLLLLSLPLPLYERLCVTNAMLLRMCNFITITAREHFIQSVSQSMQFKTMCICAFAYVCVSMWVDVCFSFSTKNERKRKRKEAKQCKEENTPWRGNLLHLINRNTTITW